MDKPEKLATYDIRDEEKKSNTTCIGHYYTQTNINNVNKTESSYNINDIPRETSCLCFQWHIFVYTMTTNGFLILYIVLRI